MPNRDGVIEGYMHRSLPKNWIQQFSWNEVWDYSFNWMVDSEEKIKETSFKMISDIEKYVKEHPNEKILVCVEQHGWSDWASCNWWTKEDWIKLANISPNIKIRSIRCFFWAAYNNKDIYNHKSSVSWFSNRYKASPYVAQPIKQALDQWLWFHEMEIYTRLNYPISVAPLTESMEYTNWSTWKIEISKIWLAQNDRLENINFNDYA